MQLAGFEILGLLLCLILVLLCLIRTVRYIGLKKRMGQANQVNQSVQPGDYVRFTGKIKQNELSSPISKVACCYWKLTISAQFYTKKKAPQKGRELNEPKLFKDSSDNLPVIISDSQQVVQTMLQDHSLMMAGLTKNKTTSKTMLLEQFKHLAKPKYQSYVIEESFYPVNQSVTLYGYVLAKHDNMVMISAGDKQQTLPCCMLPGSSKLLFKELNKPILRSLMLMVLCLALIVSYFTWMPFIISQFIAVGSIVLFLIGSVFVYKSSKPNLNSVAK